MKNFDLSIVIPVYKSDKSLSIIAKQIEFLQEQTGLVIQIIFVNDSPFYLGTCKTLENLSKQFTNIKVLTLRKNQGQHIALLVGLSQATGEYIITMDDDLQHPVSEIPKLLEAIRRNKTIDAVFAIPYSRGKRHSMWRNFGSYVINKIDGAFLNKPAGLIKSPFRILTNSLARVIINNYNSSPAVSSLIIKATENIINIEVEHNSRQFGKSGYSIKMLISLTLNNILHYSSLPLKLLGYIGASGFIFSLIFIFSIFIRKLFFDINFPGYASIVTLICFFGGLNLLAFGVVGEYLIRIIKDQQKPILKDLIK
jgi:dolichol-phosphate mannosyltransferase/undecaprenyl-phosphate 4-deoxy-4-formamido-L-arabinose transferase